MIPNSIESCIQHAIEDIIHSPRNQGYASVRKLLDVITGKDPDLDDTPSTPDRKS